jgi:dihydropyrimidine dehydrogenase (NAD+) subunit PreA
MIHGYGIIPHFIKEIRNFLERKGYKTVRDIIGIAAKSVIPSDKILEIPKLKFQITEDLCTNCGKCLELCPHDAIIKEGGKVKITEKCIGCGFCVMLCPKGAIRQI